MHITGVPSQANDLCVTLSYYKLYMVAIVKQKVLWQSCTLSNWDCCCQACSEKSGHFDTQYEWSDCISGPHMLDATPDNTDVVSRQTERHIINNLLQQIELYFNVDKGP